MIRKSVAVVALGLISLTACAGTPESKPVAQQQQEAVVALNVAENADLGPVVTDVEGFTPLPVRRRQAGGVHLRRSVRRSVAAGDRHRTRTSA